MGNLLAADSKSCLLPQWEAVERLDNREAGKIRYNSKSPSLGFYFYEHILAK